MSEMQSSEHVDWPSGLYERVVDRELRAALHSFEDRAVIQAVDLADLPYVLAEHVHTRVLDALLQLHGDNRLLLTDQVLELLDDSIRADLCSQERSDEIPRIAHLDLTGKPGKRSARQLTEISSSSNMTPTPRPNTPLLEPILLTNAGHEPAIQSELASEFLSADRVDVIIAFVKWTGFRTLERSFENLRARGVPVRLITTTYIGATERKALDRLVRDFGVQVKINYAVQSTRLHAKAWMISRNTGYHTAFIGSSNLSKSAMVDGLEWNVRVTKNSTPAVFTKFQSTFETYWESAEFERYDPDADAERLDEALAVARGDKTLDVQALDFSPIEVRPYAYQQQMLNDLELSRRRGFHKNLIVAATGTGKTVVAALDWKRLSDQLTLELGRSPRTLFVAHRQEILNQARKTFIEVAKKADLGIATKPAFNVRDAIAALPMHNNVLFASIQALHHKALQGIDRDFFDIVIVDEFHHGQAPTYRRLMSHVAPRELLAMTATPERTDGVSVAQAFFDGRIASEMRLWEALEEDILVPFHYFLNADGTDLSSVPIQAGDYRLSALSDVFTGDQARVRLIVRAIADKIAYPQSMRALCFCVDIAHAEFMASELGRYGFKVKAVTSRTNADERHRALLDLGEGKLQIICAVDIFNEGVDIPQVDTLLMLRPTQSATVFLQQLGRGLRRAPNKAILTVLDFVGNQNREFRFDLKLRALTGRSRQQLVRGVSDGFNTLPSGSQIIFDEKSQEIVLRSLRESLNVPVSRLPADIRASARTRRKTAGIFEYTLSEYLEDSLLELPDIYRSSRWQSGPLSFERLSFLAKTGADLQDDRYDDVRSRFRALCRVDDLERLSAYRQIIDGAEPRSEMSPILGQYADMLVYLIWPNGQRPKGERFKSMDEALAVLRANPGVVEEIHQIIDVRTSQVDGLHDEPQWDVESPLRIGASYSREELFAALGVGRDLSGQMPGGIREGVRYCPETNTDALLITLVKSEADYSPQTMYKDYALTPSRFHWESQNRLTPVSSTSMRYESGASNIALFIRETKTDEFGTGAAYIFAGPAKYVSSQGSKPVQFVWDLDHELPPDLYLKARAAGA